MLEETGLCSTFSLEMDKFSSFFGNSFSKVLYSNFVGLV